MGGLGSGSGSPPPQEPLEEEFKDAIEMKPQPGAETSVGGSGGVKEPARPSPAAERPATAIAAGLANVRLPLGYGRRDGRLGGKDLADDSDGEEEFHDAHDSGPGMVKDATKAREMKEIGNQ